MKTGGLEALGLNLAQPDSGEGAGRPDLATVAAKARLLERLLAGDERVLAADLRADLEALAGPLAKIVPLRRRG